MCDKLRKAPFKSFIQVQFINFVAVFRIYKERKKWTRKRQLFWPKIIKKKGK